MAISHLQHIFVSEVLTELANSAVFVTGIMRSGTTLVGNIVHSLKGVEYSFEPPAIDHLLACRELIPRTLWRYLYCHMLSEGILLPSLAGRNLNFNSNDWSYIFKVKSIKEIASRFTKTFRSADLETLVTNHTIAFKSPGHTRAVPFLKSLFPGTKVIIVVRHPDEVAASLCARKFFAESAPLSLVAGGKACSKIVVPSFISDALAKRWPILSEEERCYAAYADCYITDESAKGVLWVDYSNLLCHPYEQAVRLCTFLGAEFGSCTESVINSVSLQPKARHFKVNSSCKERRVAIEVYGNLRRLS